MDKSATKLCRKKQFGKDILSQPNYYYPRSQTIYGSLVETLGPIPEIIRKMLI